MKNYTHLEVCANKNVIGPRRSGFLPNLLQIFDIDFWHVTNCKGKKMKHTMKLAPNPFEMIKSGAKTIELRLYDEKRRNIQVGDLIEFVSTENVRDVICVKVTDIFVFDLFETLYKSLPLSECGYTTENVANASPDDMNVYYSKEEQSKCGVVGIKIALQ